MSSACESFDITITLALEIPIKLEGEGVPKDYQMDYLFDGLGSVTIKHAIFKSDEEQNIGEITESLWETALCPLIKESTTAYEYMPDAKTAEENNLFPLDMLNVHFYEINKECNRRSNISLMNTYIPHVNGVNHFYLVYKVFVTTPFKKAEEEEEENFEESWNKMTRILTS